MTDKEAITKCIKIITENTYAEELELLRWLFKKLEETEGYEE